MRLSAVILAVGQKYNRRESSNYKIEFFILEYFSGVKLKGLDLEV